MKNTLRNLLMVAILSMATRGAFAAEAVIRQPLSNDGSTPGAATVTTQATGTRNALDVALATGTVQLDPSAAVSVNIGDIEVNTAALTTASQPNAVTLTASATGTIACGASSSSYIIAAVFTAGSTGTAFYSYAGNATGNPRMVLFPNEKFVSPEGLKVTVNTINLYNASSASVTFYLECWR